MDILDFYKIKFYIIFGKQIHAENMMLSIYIGDYKVLDDVQNFLDEHVYPVLDGKIERSGKVSESFCYADIDIAETKIYEDAKAWQLDNTIAPDFILPTDHFKVILEAWRDYSIIYY